MTAGPPMNQGKIGKAGSADEFHAVVGLLYEAALYAELWPQALRQMVDFIGNSGTHVWLMDEKSKAVHHTTHVGIPDRLMADYNGDKIKECPRVGNALSRPMAELLFDYQHLSERDIDRNEYYDWLQKTGDGIRYYLAARFPAADGLTGYQSLAFRKSEGHSQPEHIRRFRILLPHVQRALTISQRLGDSQLVSHSALDLLRHLKFSVALLDEYGRIVASNESFEKLLGQGRWIRLRQNCPVLVRHGDQQKFEALVRRVAATSKGACVDPGGTVTIQHDGQIYALTVAPLRAAHGIFSSRRPAVGIFVTDRKPMVRVEPGVLQAQFGLSRAEARLAAKLLAGETLVQASVSLCVSINTVRTQLRAIFAKTGTERQADLVRLLMPTVLISASD